MLSGAALLANATSASGVYTLLSHKYWIDEIYSNAIVKPLTLASRYILGWIGEGLIVRGSAWLLAGVATLLGLWYLYATIRFAAITRNPEATENRALARQLLKVSVMYLPLLLLAMMLNAQGRLLF